MGFTINDQQADEIMNAVDDSGDQKVSYSELRAYIRKLGFDIDSLENRKGD